MIAFTICSFSPGCLEAAFTLLIFVFCQLFQECRFSPVTLVSHDKWVNCKGNTSMNKWSTFTSRHHIHHIVSVCVCVSWQVILAPSSITPSHCVFICPHQLFKSLRVDVSLSLSHRTVACVCVSSSPLSLVNVQVNTVNVQFTLETIDRNSFHCVSSHSGCWSHRCYATRTHITGKEREWCVVEESKTSFALSRAHKWRVTVRLPEKTGQMSIVTFEGDILCAAVFVAFSPRCTVFTLTDVIIATRAKLSLDGRCQWLQCTYSCVRVSLARYTRDEESEIFEWERANAHRQRHRDTVKGGGGERERESSRPVDEWMIFCVAKTFPRRWCSYPTCAGDCTSREERFLRSKELSSHRMERGQTVSEVHSLTCKERGR